MSADRMEKPVEQFLPKYLNPKEVACFPATPMIYVGQCDGAWNFVERATRVQIFFQPRFSHSFTTSSLPQALQLQKDMWGKILCVYISVKRQVFSFPCHLLWTHMICLCSKCLPIPTRTGEGHRKNLVQTRSKQKQEQRKRGGSSSSSHCRLTSQWTAKCSLPV